MKFSALFLFLTISFNCFSALINTDYDSFIDSNSGLVWIDFGQTNKLSYNEVVAELEDGGLFSAWRLPTAQEVHGMWSGSIASLYNATSNYLSAPEFDQQVFGADRSYKLNSPFESLFDIMGFNEFRTSGGDADTAVSLGHFQGFAGLAFLEVVDRSFQDGYYGDYLRLTDRPDWSADYYYNSAFPSQSTLLVRKVSEPSIAALLVFSLVFLTRKIKYNTRS